MRKLFQGNGILRFCLINLLTFQLVSPLHFQAAAQLPSSYDIIWTTPSNNPSESMPCGGGDIGMNVWVEKGDV